MHCKYGLSGKSRKLASPSRALAASLWSAEGWGQGGALKPGGNFCCKILQVLHTLGCCLLLFMPAFQIAPLHRYS